MMFEFIKKNKYMLIACAIIAAGAFAGYRYCQSSKVSTDTVKIGEVTRGTLRETVSATGAFFSLIGVIRTRTLFKNFVNGNKFIYGENDLFLKHVLEYKEIDLQIIESIGHNCIKGYEETILKLIS